MQLHLLRQYFFKAESPMLRRIKLLGFCMLCTFVLWRGDAIKPSKASDMGAKEDVEKLIIDDLVFEMVLQGAQQNQTLLISVSYDHTPDNMARIETERIMLMYLLPSLRALGYRDLAVQIYDKDQGKVDQYVQGVINEEELKNTLPFLEQTCGIQILEMARELGFKVWAIDPTHQYEGNSMLLFLDVMTGKIDRLFFENLKRKIFKEDTERKVVCILAGPYISEVPTLSDYPLGMRLSEFTNGRNFSVSMEGKEYPNKKILSDIKIHIYETAKQEKIKAI